MIQFDERPQTLACMEVWGGNSRVVRHVQLPELTAWVYSRSTSAEGGGDLHYLSICGQAALTRVVLADVSGHGAQVSLAARLLHALMREHINTWDQTEFVQGLNRSFRGCVTPGSYATAVILGILGSAGKVALTSAGHPPALWYRSSSHAWEWLAEKACAQDCGIEGLPVGLIPETTYHQTLIQLEPEDIIVLYTDGVTDAQDDCGDMLGRDRLMEWAQLAPTDCPAAAGEFLRRRLNEFRRKNFFDDETIIAIKRGSQP
jgi:phosphoserine phosphatase RsbU/P